MNVLYETGLFFGKFYSRNWSWIDRQEFWEDYDHDEFFGEVCEFEFDHLPDEILNSSDFRDGVVEGLDIKIDGFLAWELNNGYVVGREQQFDYDISPKRLAKIDHERKRSRVEGDK